MVSNEKCFLFFIILKKLAKGNVRCGVIANIKSLLSWLAQKAALNSESL